MIRLKRHKREAESMTNSETWLRIYTKKNRKLNIAGCLDCLM